MKYIEIGTQKSNGKIWIGFPEGDMVRLQSCIQHCVLKSFCLHDGDAEWIIGALRKELYGKPGDDVEIWMDDPSEYETKG